MRVRASLVCALLFGCSGAPIPPAPRAAEAPPPPRGPTVIHWGGIARGIEGGLAGRVAPDGERMTLGGWRVRVADGRVHVAETPLAGTIIATYRCGDGWLFRTSRDALAYAEDFVGAIRDLGVLPIGMFDEPILQNDHLAFVSRGGVAYQAPCGSPLRRVEPLAGETVEAVWARGRERRAVVGGAFLYVSEDEGRTWRVADGEVAIERVRFADDGRVGAGSTWLQLTEAGALVPAEAPPYAERREPLFSHIIGSAQRDAYLRASAVLLQRPAIVAALRSSRTAVLGDGTVAILAGPRSRDVNLFRGGRYSVAEGALPCEGCAVEAFGDLASAAGPGTGVHASEDGAHFRELVEPSWIRGVRPAFISGDGRHVLYQQCPEEQIWCLADVIAGRSVPLPEDRLPGLRGMAGSCYLNTLYGDADPALVCPSAETPVRVLPMFRDGEERSYELGALEDGSVLAYARAGRVPTMREMLESAGPREALDAEWLLLAAGADAAVRLEVPEGTHHVGFLDARWGIAVGDDAISFTEDGGRRWTALDLPLDGEPRTPWQELRPGLVWCARGMCSAGDLLVLREPLEGEQPRWLSGTRPVLAASTGMAALAFELACRPTGAVERSPWGRRSDGPLVLRRGRYVRPGLVLEIATRGRDVTLTWRGEDREGSFTSSAQPAPRALLAPSERASCEVWFVDRAALMLSCCEPEDESYDEDAEYAPPACRTTLLPRGGAAHTISSEAFRPDDVLRVGDELVILRSHGFAAQVVGLDASGDEAWARRFAWRLYQNRGSDQDRYQPRLAAQDGEPVLLSFRSVHGVSPVRAQPLRSRGASSAVRLDARAGIARVCGEPADGAVTTRWMVRELAIEGGDTLHDDLLAEVEIEGGSWCIRRVRTNARRTNLLDYDAHGLLEARDGALFGAIDLPDGRRQAVTCAVTETDDESGSPFLPW